jgi:hypothetical protein
MFSGIVSLPDDNTTQLGIKEGLLRIVKEPSQGEIMSDEQAKELEAKVKKLEAKVEELELATPMTDLWHRDGKEPWECCRTMERRYAKAQQQATMLVIELESLLDANRNNPTDYYRLCRSARQTLSDIGRG